jgi:hypothetical protein
VRWQRFFLGTAPIDATVAYPYEAADDIPRMSNPGAFHGRQPLATENP